MDRSSHYVASPTGVDVALPLAGLGSRSYAFLIDWHIRLVLALAWFMAAALIAVGSLAVFSNSEYTRALAVVTLPATAIYLLYHPVLEILMRGRTPGKRMAGVRIVTRSGGTPSAGALLVRNVFRLIDMLPAMYLVGLVTTIFSREHVRLGDIVAGTLLVHDDAQAVEALSAFDSLTQDSKHDPVAVDVANELLRRWDELAPARRTALARSVLAQLGAQDAASGGTGDRDESAALRSALVRTLRGSGT